MSRTKIKSSDITTGVSLSEAVLSNGYTEQVYTLGTSGTLALNPANGSIQTSAASGDITFSDSLAAGQSIVLYLTNGSSHVITWPTMTWASSTGNTAPTLTGTDTVVLWKISSTLYGSWVGSSD